MNRGHGAIRPHDDSEHPHWNDRREPFWKSFAFNQPYAQGLARLRREVLGRTNFEPATLWQWGTMQAMAILQILKSAEERFGAEGQKLVEESLTAVGYDIGRQACAETTVPDQMSTAEWVSCFATVMNTIAYASLESAQVEDDGHVNFHIDWCPHQDMYGPFDCRVQRYFVQGMIDAAMEFLKEQGRDDAWNGMFNRTIPNGAPTCFFRLERQTPGRAARWESYTKRLEERARREGEG